MNFTLTIDKNKENLEEIIDFFNANKTDSYISHSEIISGRADDHDHWSPDLAKILYEELSNEDTIIITAKYQNKLKGIMLLGRMKSKHKNFLMFDDILVDENTRGHNLGHKMMEFAIEYAIDSNVEMIFAESGITNEKAHHFIEKFGFEKVSINYIKKMK